MHRVFVPELGSERHSDCTRQLATLELQKRTVDMYLPVSRAVAPAIACSVRAPVQVMPNFLPDASETVSPRTARSMRTCRGAPDGS